MHNTFQVVIAQYDPILPMHHAYTSVIIKSVCSIHTQSLELSKQTEPTFPWQSLLCLVSQIVEYNLLEHLL